MPKAVIIIPCYNEEKRFPVAEFKNHATRNPEILFVLVNDGSTDGTSSLLKSLTTGNVQYFELKQNSGKAEAIRQCILDLGAPSKTHVEIIGFLDADFATPVGEALRLINTLENDTRLKLVFGSRIKRLGTSVERKFQRHYPGRIFATVASAMLGIAVYDTQCGAKFFRREICGIAFSQPFVSRWLFDIEIFFRIKEHLKNGAINTIALEVPLDEWADKGGSKLKLTYLLKVPFELLWIYIHYRKK